jgi:thiamine-phosphate diphosphorylase
MPAARVATIMGPASLIGQSVHMETGLSSGQMKGVHYLLFGTVYPSASKRSGHPVAGLEALETSSRQVECPVLAVGGITVERCGDVVRRGASGVAGISLFADAWRQGGGALREVVTRVMEECAQVERRWP